MKRGIAYLVLFMIMFSFAVPVLYADEPEPEKKADEKVEEKKEEKKEFKRPKYQVQRFKEDWSVLADAEEADKTDMFDKVKYLPLDEEGKIWANFGGQLRLRLEGWNNFAFLETGNRDEIFLQSRLFIHGELNVGEHFRFFVEGKHSSMTHRHLPGEKRGLDVDEAELHNTFGELRAPLPLGDKSQIGVRVGRQELLFGKQRLVSPLNWANTRRIFDGGLLYFDFDNKDVNLNVSAFAVRPVPVQKYSFNDNDTHTTFMGIYSTIKAKSMPIGVDFYWIDLDKDLATFAGVSGRHRLHTIGGRFWGKMGALDFDIEAANQFGDIGNSDISAYMVTGDIGFTLPKMNEGTPRFFVGLGLASGDEGPGVGKVTTFNHLAPLGHAYHGWIDVIGRQNLIDLHTGFSMKGLMKKLSFAVTGHVFWRHSDQDALYNPGGAAIRPGIAGSSSRTGSEIDLMVKYQFDPHLFFLVGYSHFFVDDYIEDSQSATRGDDPIDFVFFITQYTF